ncbi:MAG: hypothetical protein IJ394_04680 [Bacteroidales bacterium]|nr:hypothetical protein [Bacteroidales bacterium]
MKRILTYISFITLMLSCGQELIEECPDVKLVERTFKSYVEKDTATKVLMDGTYESEFRSVLFEPQDAIAVFEHGSETVSEFRNTVEDENTDCAIFKGVVADGENYSAFYPYSILAFANAGMFHFTMPYTQSYVKDNIDATAFPMLATLEGDTFMFKNLCGIFVLKLLGTGSVSRIVFYPKDEAGEPMGVAGSASAITLHSVPYIDFDYTLNFMELDCGEGVALSETEATTFHMVLPPNEYPSFEIMIELTDGAIMTKKSEKPLTITRSQRTTAAILTFKEDVVEMSDPVDLSSDGKSANCYIVSEAGTYKFSPVKGNGNESVGAVASAEVLWESFGTSETPVVGDLIQSVSYSDGSIIFSTPETYREGNAVIAAKDADGTILWSWHIWLTDKPEEQVYYNNAGTMMDRNLGATSATPGDVGALGLLYQWGRKDPFLGSSSISENILAESTITWPSSVSSTSDCGTIDYVIQNPMTFITQNDSNYDWYYTGSSSTDNTRWQSENTIYDPCPAGWRVPDGGDNGVWSTAVGSSTWFYTYSDTYKGMNFLSKFGSGSSIWYPATGERYSISGSIVNVGSCGYYWSVTPLAHYAHALFLYSNGDVYHPVDYRANGRSIRCQKEEEIPNEEIDAVDLNADSETANSYIVSESGTYRFKSVKGNSSESVGSVASVEVLWESFGTSETPVVGDLIRSVSYSDGSIIFSTPETYREGNAVIAAKDSDGTILWSWHIWLTDQPEEQVYYNNAGTMMDRNLGATSATPGDVGALGLLYQWGRKDPFLGSSDISSNVTAASTLSWPSSVASSSNGTIDYAVKHPTTFITYSYHGSNIYIDYSNYDWYYTGDSSTDNTRWQSEKTIYDPCPAGWRVPDGGSNGVWSVSLGSSSILDYTYSDTNEGMNFSGKFGNGSSIWYPAAGYRDSGSLYEVGSSGYYWSVTPDSLFACEFGLFPDGRVYPLDSYRRYNGKSVRCLQE